MNRVKVCVRGGGGGGAGALNRSYLSSNTPHDCTEFMMVPRQPKLYRETLGKALL